MSILLEQIHPGEVLNQLYLETCGISAIKLSKHLGVPRTRIERLIKGTTSMSPDTAIRLAKAFNTTAAYWLNMQTNFDIAETMKSFDNQDIKPIVAA